MALSKQQRDELSAMPYEPIHLTAEGLKRFKERLAELKRAYPGYAAEAKRTADFGDRSENEEYRQAKSVLRRTHSRIIRMEDQLKRIIVIDRGSRDGIIGIGSTVIIESIKDGEKKTYEIVGPMETNPTRGRISNQSPLGAALIGHSKNEIIKISAGGGTREYRILEIR